MKRKSLNKKLILKKMTISQLDNIKGGDYDDPPYSYDYTCDCGGTGGNNTVNPGTNVNPMYTHRPCISEHAVRTTCE